MRPAHLAAVCALLLACAGEPPADAPPDGRSDSDTAAAGGAGPDTPDAGGAGPGGTPAAPHDWLLVPGGRLGPVEGDTSEEELRRRVGEANVRRGEAHIGEGFCAAASFLYPDTPDQVEVMWSDGTYTRPAVARVSGPGSRWRTEDGVAVGTPLAELERLAGGPVEFAGFGWDYGGRASWPQPAPEGRSVELVLAPEPDSLARVLSDPRTGEILGEEMVRSDHPVIARLAVHVERMSVRFGPRPEEHQCAPR